ncbi:MAG: hypothetical protein FJX72_04620 [Armatimonadetes bacterium]|nr:hypothetical protein [Armatimonadota bacterium]
MRLRYTTTATVLAGLLAAVGGGQAPSDRVARTNQALKRAAAFLVRTQSKDGAWRSKTYGIMRDGTALTPLVLSGLFFMPQGGDTARTAYRSACAYFRSFVRPDGTIREPADGFTFPVLSSASASRVVVLLDRTEANARTQRAWLRYMRDRQLTERLGWSPGDTAYGGWGFSLAPPRRPATGSAKGLLIESNMVATIFWIAALRSAKTPPDDPAFASALMFIKRCQNYADDPTRRDERFDDGGFFFIPDDPLQNKAGIAGHDRFGRERYHSYGTMTADGLRALIRCGLPHDHERVIAARRWLERRFVAAHNPGTFAPDREVLRDATYYYWCWAVAHAFAGMGIRTIQTTSGPVDWAAALADELIRRQRADGSWKNRYTDAKEDDPLIATAWAAAALAIGRESVTGERITLAAPSAPPSAGRSAPRP